MSHFDVILTQERALISLDLTSCSHTISVHVWGDPDDDDAFASMWDEFDGILLKELQVGRSPITRLLYSDILSIRQLLAYASGYPEAVMELIRRAVRRSNKIGDRGPASLGTPEPRQSSDNS